MSMEENKQLIRAHFEELMNRKNLSRADEHLAADFIDHEALPGFEGTEGVKRYLADVHRSFPDIHATIEDIIAEDDRAVVRNTWRGTHLGEFQGIQPTSKRIEMKDIVTWRIRDGKIVERWATIDQLEVLKQLGVLD